MNSSFTIREVQKRNVVFCQDNVVVATPGPFIRGEIAYSGKLQIVNENHGYVIEWNPVKPIESNGMYSPCSDAFDWEDVSSTAVGYKVEDPEDGRETVEIKPLGTIPRVISFDVPDLKSLRKDEKPDGLVIATFYLRDGSTIHSFYFKNDASFLEFFGALRGYAPFKRSNTDKDLYLIEETRVSPTDRSFNRVELASGHRTDLVSKIIKNPYETALGGFSKVTSFVMDYVLYPNGTYAPIQFEDQKIVEFLSESFSQMDINNQEEPGYELITCIQMPPRPEVKREIPVSLDEWQSHFDADGKIKDLEKLKHRMFKGGLMHSARSQAWKFLLDYYSFDSSYAERDHARKQNEDYYFLMKLQWKNITSDQESRFSAFRERRSLIEKDVSRTDRTHPFFEGEGNTNIQMLYDILMTYCMYNFDLGYVQGMSDLLSPILVVMKNEVEAFWCFVGWMNKIGANFEMDQQGIKSQLQSLHRLIHFVDSHLCEYLESHESGNLYFAFRWLLILFKRDFKFEEIMRLWEVLWTGLPCKNFHLLICLAILDTEKSTIIENGYGLTEILKHINDMAYKINLEETLCKAEAIYEQISQCGHLSDIIQNILGIEVSTKDTVQVLSPVSAEEKCDKFLNECGPGIAVQVKASGTDDTGNSLPDDSFTACDDSSLEESFNGSKNSVNTFKGGKPVQRVNPNRHSYDENDEYNAYLYPFDLYTA